MCWFLLIDQHLPEFTGKCSLCISKKYRRPYHIPAETESFVQFAGDTLYFWSRNKWKLWLNKITSGVDQQAK